MTFALGAYLERIGYHGPAEATAATLAAIQHAHLLTVPFENLDIALLGRPISLAPDDLARKIVGERRGGFCYELNGLLATALETIGFSVDRASARWPDADAADGLGAPFDHLVLVVTAPGEPEP